MSLSSLYKIKYIKGDNDERSFNLTECSALNLCGDRWTISDEGEGARLHFLTENSTSSDSKVIKPDQILVAPRYKASVIVARSEGSEGTSTSSPSLDSPYQDSDTISTMTIDPQDGSALDPVESAEADKASSATYRS
ncbi:hypothetical protein L486_04323 [Kwoniella mangroviensis CBS 10435]|uniref:Uncharacterized protein n=1 Tax=Kwoniella mangroviensis CBS 10435 TaxID=1331196 RepID=A0A1B9IS03_9TREE|nr:hypothetical protein L486_04323 [Kwoniella mangroviensis CBS 10435]